MVAQVSESQECGEHLGYQVPASPPAEDLGRVSGLTSETAFGFMVVMDLIARAPPAEWVIFSAWIFELIEFSASST